MRIPLRLISFAVLLCVCKAGDDGRRGRVEVVDAKGMTEWDRVNLERNLRWVIAREREARPAERSLHQAIRVGVFADAGVWHVGARSIVEALENEGVACRVLERSVFRDNALARFDAVVMPGGWAPYQWSTLGDTGLNAIREYVEGGGRCLGICAGAYLLARTTRYDGASYDYPLGLFDGKAAGPVEGLARFPNPGEARLSMTDEGRRRGLAALAEGPLYYSGGPCFLEGTDVRVLARYADGSAAAISRKVGKGEIALIGVHVERPASSADDDAPPPASAGALLKALVSPSA